MRFSTLFATIVSLTATIACIAAPIPQGAKQNVAKGIVGYWEGGGGYYAFREDGTFSRDVGGGKRGPWTCSGRYTVEGTKVTLKVESAKAAAKPGVPPVLETLEVWEVDRLNEKEFRAERVVDEKKTAFTFQRSTKEEWENLKRNK